MRLLFVIAICAYWQLPAQADALDDGRAAIDAGDYAKALRILKPMAEHGDADAQNALGLLYLEGWGVGRDYEQALRWFLNAVEQGHAKAQVNLGDMYKEGMGVEQDYAEAARLFRLSARQGYAGAEINLGYLYALGLGMPRDDAEAVRRFRIAAEQGDATGQGLLGACYARGQGVEQDYAEALKWYRISAEQGSAESQKRVGFMYEYGEGVRPDKVEALKWYRMAAEQGHSGAKERLDVLVAGSASRSAAEGEPTLQQALTAPAADLAKSHLWVKIITKIIPSPEGGSTLQLGDETITSNNAEEYRQKYNKRLSIYGEAIKQRGYKTVSGAYRSKTSKSCARIQSSWVSLLHEASAHEIEIMQDGFELRFIIKAEYEDHDLATENRAVIAESAIAILDEMNTSYYFRGVIKGNKIEIKPDVSVLRSWPRWADPPSRRDLEKCTITLEPLSGEYKREVEPVEYDDIYE